MKRNFLGTWYLIPALLLATAVLVPGILLANATAEAALVQEIPAVGTPAVTVRLVATNTTQIKDRVPAENPPTPAPLVDIPVENGTEFVIQPPATTPTPNITEAVNLVTTDNNTYNFTPAAESPVQAHLVN